MIRPTKIIHPGMLRSLAAFYPTAVTIQQAVEVQDTVGEEQPTWEDVQVLWCRVSPDRGEEIRLPGQIFAIGSHKINLRGYYPDIDVEMRAVVAETYYDIIAVEHDGQAHTTRLTVQVVT